MDLCLKIWSKNLGEQQWEHHWEFCFKLVYELRASPTPTTNKLHFDWPITIVLGKHLTLPQNRSVERGLLLAHLYMLRKFNFGQQLWHKLCCYWEHLEEHIGNLVNMMGMSLQTCGRNIGNNCFEHHTLTPLVYKCKEPGLLWCTLSHSISCMKILFTKLFVTNFGLG